MLNSKNNYKNIKKVIKELYLNPEWEDCIFIYTDNIQTIKEINRTSCDKIFIINDDENNLHMIDSTFNYANQLEKDNESKINTLPSIDVIILENKEKNIEKELIKHIDEHTIISKIFQNNVIYIEDTLKQIKIIITKRDTLIFEGNGINTDLISYTHNT